ncbi:MAG: VIT domain-containing protein [Candidatus Melainabacteria bacterium]|nr:VIT domain-containing protein [Candidatus Melainabacteria bacterium]
MPIIHETEIERLERIWRHPESEAPRSVAQEKNVSSIKFLALAAVGFAIYTAINPDFGMMSVGALILASLLFLNHSIQRGNPTKPSAFSRIRNLSIFAVAVAVGSTIIAFLYSTTQPALFAVPSSQENFLFDANVPSDAHLGTTVVGEKIPGLSLKNTLVTGHVDARSLTSAMYMSMVFGNSTSEAKEARARIALPPDAVVSRVTLWINGVEQEAAFNSAERVQAAYQWIVNSNRDPLLVTETRKGEVFLQAFPVPANGEMKVRLGITTPLDVKSRKDFQLTAPHLVSSNFGSTGVSSDVKLESNAIIDSNLTDQKLTEGVKDSYTLSGSIKADDFEKCLFSIHRKSDFVTYASRATHSAENSFIVNRLEKDGDSFKLVSEKTQLLPAVAVAYDFPTASRMSTVWAIQEARKCLDQNDIHTAAMLGCAYRIVTKATGAVVLENDSDYQRTGLSREQYKVVSAQTKASAANMNVVARTSGMIKDKRGIYDPHTAFFGSPIADPAYVKRAQSMHQLEGAVPTLQGATNGTIGPQGGDATSIMGFNTAGTVRVNNLANLESLMNLITIAAQFTGITGGIVLVTFGLFKNAPYHQTVNRLLLGSSCLMVGIFSPCVVDLLIRSARDANWFS